MIDPKTHEKLIQVAIDARKKAYAPYSKYHVGAALLASSGTIYSGCNVENAAIFTTCAERTALCAAVCQGDRKFLAIAVATENGGAPCGNCRQLLREFAEDIEIISVDAEKKIQKFTLATIFPHSFGPHDLKESGVL